MTANPVQAAATGRTVTCDPDGVTITAHGLQKAAMGTGELRLSYTEIPCYWHRPPTKFMMGILRIGTPHGKLDIAYPVKHASGFDDVAAALGAAGVPMDEDAVKSLRMFDIKRQDRLEQREELRKEMADLRGGVRDLRNENRQQNADFRQEMRESWDELKEIGRGFKADAGQVRGRSAAGLDRTSALPSPPADTASGAYPDPFAAPAPAPGR